MEKFAEIKAVGETVNKEISAFRSSAVTAENRATPLARSVLGALIAGTATSALVVSLTLHAFGNPKTAKGKAMDSLTSSGDYLPGFGLTRKTIGTVLAIFDNIDVDAPVTTGEGDEAVTVGTGAIRELLVSFILNESGAPKSLRALNESVKAAIAAHTASIAGDNSEAVEQAEQAQADEGGTQEPTLADRVNALIVAYQAANGEAKAEAHGNLQALFAMVNADVAADAEANTEELEAAE